MALWLTRSGGHCQYEAKFLDENRIYLTWSGLDRNLGPLNTPAEVHKTLKDVYPQDSIGRRRQNAGQLFAFAQKMAPGDWVAMPSKRKTVHIGEIAGPYTFEPRAENPYYHYRAVRWLETDIPRTNFDQDILNSLGAFTTICQIKRNDAEARVRAMKDNGWKATGTMPRVVSDDEEDSDELTTNLDIEQVARDQIARHLYAKYAGHGLEDLVEAVLKAQGYTTHHSSKGPDGGVDILAAPDTLGFGRPRICVQVKSQTSPLERTVLDQLVGRMQQVGADQGLLVCWGGFKTSILREVSQTFFKVRLWDQSDLIDNFLAAYERLDEDIRAEIPIKRIWAMTMTERDEEE